MKTQVIYKPIPLLYLILILVQLVGNIIFLLFLLYHYCVFAAPVLPPKETPTKTRPVTTGYLIIHGTNTIYYDTAGKP